MATSSPQASEITIATEDMKIARTTLSLIKPFAFSRFFGSMIAMGYVKAAIGANTVTIAVKIPNRPNASGPYRRVIKGENATVMAWAPAVPVATTTTLRMNLLFVRAFTLAINVSTFD